jgi:hypothetical protein
MTLALSIEQIDVALGAEGWPRLSPWWKETIEAAYATAIRNIVIRGGRRGGKSSSICGKVVTHEVLSDKHQIPPGDVGYFAIVSADKDQAQERLDTCHKALKALGIAHRKTANEITLTDRNVGIKCFAATLQAVVGFTCIGFLADEVARWRDRDTGENPAKQIITSLRACMATIPHARGWYVSSPWSTLDEHHRMVEEGTTEAQLVFTAPTWVMNPTLTEEETHRLEPDLPSWSREYGAIPMPSDETKFFAAEFIDLAAKMIEISNAVLDATHARFGTRPVADRTVAGADFAFRRNSSALAVLDAVGARFVVKRTEERIPGLRALVPSKTIGELVGIAVDAGADAVACDLHYIETVREVTDGLALPLLEFPSDSDGIVKAYIRTRVLLAEGRLDLSRAMPKLLQQLKETVSKPTQTGMTISNPLAAGAHGDLVSALVCAVWAADQPPPMRDPLIGSRRFGRDGSRHEPAELTDLPPEDWE